jgi:hypothetical protein
MLACWRSVAIAFLSISLAACGGAQMVKTSEAPVIRADESMVVFMRSSFMGAAISASVFDVSGPETKFIGIVNNGTKVGYPVKPGQHTFMVVSESADFLQANVVPGKTYYAMVTPRMGAFKARFSFKPVRQGDGDFAGASSGTSYVVNSPESQNWAAQNAADIASKRTQYWADWSNKPASDRAAQTLNAEDGR